MIDTPLDLDDALEAILADTRPVSRVEEIELEAALGRVLAAPVDAPISLPPFPASAMDGYALRSDALSGAPPYLLNVTGTSFAGRPLQGTVAPGGCVRIFTGAPVPTGLDAVVIQEHCRAEDGRVHVETSVSAGDNVRPVGHDVAAGTRILGAGKRLTTFDLGWLAACGMARVPVAARPTIAIFSTGDELVSPGERPEPGQIYDANRLTLGTLLRMLPVQVHDYGIVPDDREQIRSVLEQADASSDMIVTSGGVSVGEADWVKEVVSEMGSLQLWKLNLKPGKPLAYGRLSRAAFFGLPGNPVSTIVTALMLTRPAVERLCGGTPAAPFTVPARLRGALRHQPGREEFQRATLRHGREGLEVSVTGDQSSNRLASFAQANCLIRISKESADLADGSLVMTLPFAGLL